MACSKYTLTNTGTTVINFNYRRCDDSMWEYQVELEPNQTKNIWLINNTYSIAPSYVNGVILNNQGEFPPTGPTPTPSTTAPSTPTPTPTPTGTPAETPTGTPAETPTGTPAETPAETPTGTPTGTPAETPAETPTGTPTGTPTPTPTQSLFETYLGQDIISYAGACSNYTTGGTVYYTSKIFGSLVNGDYIYTDSGLSTQLSYDGFVSNGTVSYVYNASGIQSGPTSC